MELIEAIKNRRSIRKYKSDPISQEKINLLLEAAIWAPHPWGEKLKDRWEFIVVKDADMRKKMYAVANEWNKHMVEAPVNIVVSYNMPTQEEEYGPKYEFYLIQASSAAIQNLMLKAYEEGLGSCWIGSFDEKKLKAVLDIPAEVRSVAIVTVGYPDEKPAPPTRKSLDQVVHMEKY